MPRYLNSFTTTMHPSDLREVPVVGGVPYTLFVAFGALALLLASCLRFSTFSLVYFFSFFVSQTLGPKRLSGWLVLFAILAFASVLACVMHTVWAISLAMGFAFPPEILFVLQGEMERGEENDPKRVFLKVLPDVVVCLYSVAGLVRARKERNAAFLRLEGVEEEERRGSGVVWWICSCIGHLPRSPGLWAVAVYVSSLAACVSNISIITWIMYVSLQCGAALYVMRVVNNVRAFLAPALRCFRIFVAAVCISWYTVLTVTPHDVDLDWIGFVRLDESTWSWAGWTSLGSFLLLYIALGHVLYDVQQDTFGTRAAIRGDGADLLSDDFMESAERSLLADTREEAPFAPEEEETTPQRPEGAGDIPPMPAHNRPRTLTEALIGSAPYAMIERSKGWLKMQLRAFKLSKRFLRRSILLMVFLMTCSTPTATWLFSPLLVWVVLTSCVPSSAVYKVATSNVFLRIMFAYWSVISSLVFLFGIDVIKQEVLGGNSEVLAQWGLAWDRHAWSVVLMQSVALTMCGGALRHLGSQDVPTYTPKKIKQMRREVAPGEPSGWRWWILGNVNLWEVTLTARTLWRVLWKLLWTYTHLLVMFFLYFAGVLHVNVLNVVYLFFFVIFAVKKKWREKYWHVLVMYAGIVLIAKFLFKTTKEPSNELWGLFSGPTSTSGYVFYLLFDTSNNFEFAIAAVIFLTSAWQLQLYSSDELRDNVDILTQLTSQLPQGVTFVLFDVPMQLVEKGGLLVLTVVLFISALQPPTVTSLFSLIDIIGILFITAVYVGNDQLQLRWTRRWIFWWIVVEGIMLVALYLYQLEVVFEWVGNTFLFEGVDCDSSVQKNDQWQCSFTNNNNTQPWLTQSDVGLRKYDESSRVAGFLINFITFMVLLIQFNSLGRIAHRRQQHGHLPTLVTPDDHYRALSDEEGAHLVRPVTIEVELRTQNGAWKQWFLDAATASKYVCYVHGCKVGLLVAAYLCARTVSVINFILLCTLCFVVIFTSWEKSSLSTCCDGKRSAADEDNAIILPMFIHGWRVVFAFGALKGVAAVCFQFGAFFHLAKGYFEVTEWVGLTVAWLDPPISGMAGSTATRLQPDSFAQPKRALISQMVTTLAPSIGLIVIGVLMKLTIKFRSDAQAAMAAWSRADDHANLTRRTAGEGISAEEMKTGEEVEAGGAGSRRYRPCCIGLRLAMSEYINFYAAYDVTIGLILLAAFAHVDIFSLLYMICILVATTNSHRVQSPRKFSFVVVTGFVSTVVKYIANLQVPEQLAATADDAWKQFLTNIDVDTRCTGLARWLSLEKMGESTLSCLLDFIIVMASMVHVRRVWNFNAAYPGRSTDAFVPTVSSLDNFTMKTWGAWDQIQLVSFKYAPFVFIVALYVAGLMLTAGNYGLMGIGYTAIASYLVWTNMRLNLSTLGKVRTYNVLMMLLIIVFQAPLYSLPEVVQNVVVNHNETLDVPEKCRSDVGCLTIVLLGLRKLNPASDTTEMSKGTCGCFAINATTTECPVDCGTALGSPLYFFGHFTVFLAIIITSHILSHPAYTEFMPTYFETMEATCVKNSDIVAGEEKFGAARIWYSSLKAYAGMKNKLMLVISQIEVWQHEVRNGGLNKSGARALPNPPENLKGRITDTDGTIELTWNGETTDRIVYYRIVMQRFPSAAFMGEFQVVASVKNEEHAIIEDLEPATKYEFKICAYNGWGESVYSAPMVVTVPEIRNEVDEDVPIMPRSPAPVVEVEDGIEDAILRDPMIKNKCFTFGKLRKIVSGQTEAFCGILVLLIPLASTSVFSMVLFLSFFMFNLIEQRRKRYLYWTYVLYYTLFLFNVRLVCHVVALLFPIDPSPKSTQFFTEPFVPIDASSGSRVGIWILEASLIAAIMFHRHIVHEAGFWPNDNAAANTQPPDWNEEVVAQAGGEPLVILNDITESMFWRHLPLCMSKYFDRVAPRNVDFVWPEVNESIVGDAIESREQLDDVLSYVGSVVGSSMLKKTGYNYYSYAFAWQIVYLFWRLIVNALNATGGANTLFAQRFKSYLFSLLFIGAYIFLDRIAYAMADLRLKLVAHYLFSVLVCSSYYYYGTREKAGEIPIPWQWHVSMILLFIILYYSALQIRHGYVPLARDRRPMTSRHGYGPLMSVSFSIFQYAPFIKTIRAFMDYITAKTSLDAFMWLKFDDIHAHLFKVKCEMFYRERFANVLSGKEEYPRGWKVLYADLIAWLLFLLLFVPPAFFVKDINNSFATKSTHGTIDALTGNVHLQLRDSMRQIVDDIELFRCDNQYRTTYGDSQRGENEDMQTVGLKSTPDLAFTPPPQFVSEINALLEDQIHNSSLVFNFEVTSQWTEGEKPLQLQKANYNFSIPLSKNNNTNFVTALRLYMSGANITHHLGFLEYPYEVSLALKQEPQRVEIHKYTNVQRNRRVGIDFIVDTYGRGLWKLTVDDNIHDSSVQPSGIQLQMHLNRSVSNPFADLTNSVTKSWDIAPFPWLASLALYYFVFIYSSSLVRSFFGTKIESIAYDEIKYPDLLLDICNALFILRNERYPGHMSDEIQLYYFLLDVLKSNTTLQHVTWTDPKLRFDALVDSKKKTD